MLKHSHCSGRSGDFDTTAALSRIQLSRTTMIQELDLVALLIDRPAVGLRRDDVGTVVHIYDNGDLNEVEFINAKGDTVAVETLTADEVRRVDEDHVMLHYSDLESAA